MAKKRQASRGQQVKRKNTYWQDYIKPVIASQVFRKGVALSVLLALMFAAQQYFDSKIILPIEKVHIEGEFKYLSKSNLQQHALPFVSGGFFTIDLTQVRDQLLDLPWVEDISIRRQWPDTLSIRVIEKQPVAFWGDKQLLSSKASLFRPESIDSELSLPKLIGPEGLHESMLQDLGRMQAWLIETGLVITQIKQDDRRSWTIYMRSGLELRLGRHHRHDRLNRFVDVYTEKLQKKKDDIKHIDMRYTNGLAVAWKQAQQAQRA